MTRLPFHASRLIPSRNKSEAIVSSNRRGYVSIEIEGGSLLSFFLGDSTKETDVIGIETLDVARNAEMEAGITARLCIPVVFRTGWNVDEYLDAFLEAVQQMRQSF